MTPGQKFREAVRRERPLQVAGVIHALAAKLAEEAGFRALYVSGAGVANASFGKPDLGLTSLEQVAEEVSRISRATDLPVLVDIDTGWGRNLFSGRTMKLLHKAGAAAVQLEDHARHLQDPGDRGCAEGFPGEVLRWADRADGGGEGLQGGRRTAADAGGQRAGGDQGRGGRFWRRRSGGVGFSQHWGSGLHGDPEQAE